MARGARSVVDGIIGPRSIPGTVGRILVGFLVMVVVGGTLVNGDAQGGGITGPVGAVGLALLLSSPVVPVWYFVHRYRKIRRSSPRPQAGAAPRPDWATIARRMRVEQPNPESSVAAGAALWRWRIVTNPAWGSELLVDQRVTLDVDDEVRIVVERMQRSLDLRRTLRRPSAARPGAGQGDSTLRAAWESFDSQWAGLDEVVRSTARRVLALADYADALERVRRAQVTLSELERYEHSSDSVADLLAETGADRHRIDDVHQMQERLTAAQQALREQVGLLSEPVVRLDEFRQADEAR